MPQLSQDRRLPTAIINLRLGAALQGCGAIGVADAFDKSDAEHLYVYDDRALGYTDWADVETPFASKCFHAINPNHTTIALLPLDGRIVTGASIVVGGICDGMLVSEKETCFVEFKTNVTSTNGLTILQRAQEAVEQLWHTYDGIIKPRCASKTIQIEKLVPIEFYVVFDKDLEVTDAQASLMDLQNEFLEDNQYQLYFDNKKEFK